MNIIVSQIILPFKSNDADAFEAALAQLRLKMCDVAEISIYRRSFDMRHGAMHRIFSVEIVPQSIKADCALGQGLPNVKVRADALLPVSTGKKPMTAPPIIIGFGPAGIFTALILSKNGYNPIVLERGADILARDAAVERFNKTGKLDKNSNIQFGEGGAGAYSDGKLTTRINDPRCQLVLKLLVEHGAPSDALKTAKPHIGTDLLKDIVVSMRNEVIKNGGSVHFQEEVIDFTAKHNAISSVKTKNGDIPCDVAVLATGHSARDLFKLLADKRILLERKPFSVGVRIEHLQKDIDLGLYGRMAGAAELPPGEYSLSNQLEKRGCYSFCMCPGGHVVAAASEEGMLAVNGMSYHARDGVNANSAICASVNIDDFDGDDPLAGIAFQRSLEHAAFVAGGGNFMAPVQLYGDFVKGKVSSHFGNVLPTYPVGQTMCDLNAVLPDFISESIKQSMPEFGKKIRGFDDAHAVLTGVESRTSSPVRITRDMQLNSVSLIGLIPCGEGAGYAGGIVSAAVDGIRAAEAIMREYAPLS